MNKGIEFIRKFAQAYRISCRPLCQKLKIPQTAFDILMFLANNPEYKTASDIVEVRGIKANLVSVNVDKLVRDGYLKRENAKDDRRKTLLICTDKAQTIIKEGQKLQETFMKQLFEDTDEQTQKIFFILIESMEKNLEKILKEDK